MAKFAFLFALVIVLVAVASAEWTMEGPAAGNITPGSQITFNFKTSIALSGADPLVVYISESFFDSFVVAGEGNQSPLDSEFIKISPICTVNSPPVPIASVSMTNSQFTLNFFKNIAAESIISCIFRIFPEVQDEATYVVRLAPQPTEDVHVYTVKAAPVVVDIISASPNIDGTTKVTIKFSSLTPNTLYGPFTVGYKFSNGETSSDAYTASWMTTSDYKSIFDYNARFVRFRRALPELDSKLWLLVGAIAPATAEATVEYGPWNSGFKQLSLVKDEQYSVWIKNNDENTPPTKSVATVSFSRDIFASIYYSGGTTVHYSMYIPKNLVPNPTFEFAIDAFSEYSIFGDFSTLSYSVDGGAAIQIDFTDKKFKYELVAEVNRSISVSGSFRALSFVLASINASIGGQSASKTVTVGSEFRAVSDFTVDSDILTYTYQVQSNLPTLFKQDYTGSIDYQIVADVVYFGNEYSYIHGDIRALGANLPECKSDNSKVVSVSGKPAKDGLDLNRILVTTSGTLERGSSIHHVTCAHKLHSGPKAATLEISVSQGIKKKLSVFPFPVTLDFNQQATIFGPAITDQLSMQSVLDRVTTLLGPQFPGSQPSDFKYYYSHFIQHYSANIAGLVSDFSNPMVNHYSNVGSRLILTFNRLGSAPKLDTTLYGEDVIIYNKGVENDDPRPFEGIGDVAAFIDGSLVSDYELSTSIGFGYGFPCATSAQCSSGICLKVSSKGICSERDQLSRAQQAAIKEGPDNEQVVKYMITGVTETDATKLQEKLDEIFTIAASFIALDSPTVDPCAGVTSTLKKVFPVQQLAFIELSSTPSANCIASPKVQAIGIFSADQSTCATACGTDACKCEDGMACTPASEGPPVVQDTCVSGQVCTKQSEDTYFCTSDSDDGSDDDNNSVIASAAFAVAIAALTVMF